jgi:hypothetical protein
MKISLKNHCSVFEGEIPETFFPQANPGNFGVLACPWRITNQAAIGV